MTMAQNKVTVFDDDIVEIQVIGDQTRATVLAMGELANGLLNSLKSQNKRCLVLDDVTAMGVTDTAARRAVKDLASSLHYEKAAMVGSGNLVMRYGTKFLLQAIGMDHKIKYFENRQDAINWLRS